MRNYGNSLSLLTCQQLILRIAQLVQHLLLDTTLIQKVPTAYAHRA